MRAPRVARLALIVVWVFGSLEARAEEPDKLACIASHAGAQRARLAGKLRVARREAIACAQATCPAALRAECTDMLPDIERAIPSLLVEARTPEVGSTLDVTLEIDGEVTARRLDGTALPLDPGEHVVRVVLGDGRAAEQRVVLLEGEARRRVTLQLPAPVARAAADAASSGARAPEPLSAPPKASWLPFAAAGVGVVSLGVFTVFGLRGYREQVALETRCAPACAPGADEAMRRDYVVADIALVASALALAGATWLFLDARSPQAPASTRSARR